MMQIVLQNCTNENTLYQSDIQKFRYSYIENNERINFFI